MAAKLADRRIGNKSGSGLDEDHTHVDDHANVIAEGVSVNSKVPEASSPLTGEETTDNETIHTEITDNEISDGETIDSEILDERVEPTNELSQFRIGRRNAILSVLATAVLLGCVSVFVLSPHSPIEQVSGQLTFRDGMNANREIRLGQTPTLALFVEDLHENRPLVDAFANLVNQLSVRVQQTEGVQKSAGEQQIAGATRTNYIVVCKRSFAKSALLSPSPSADLIFAIDEYDVSKRLSVAQLPALVAIRGGRTLESAAVPVGLTSPSQTSLQDGTADITHEFQHLATLLHDRTNVQIRSGNESNANQQSEMVIT